MSREIKFRAYLKKHDHMVSVEIIDWNEKYIVHEDLNFGFSDVTAIDIPDPECVTNLDELALMQYTGLKDKNGTEIYEGDVVLVLDRDWPSGDYTHQTPEEYMRSIASKCKVIFKDGGFILSQIKGRGYFHEDITMWRGRDICEVIGNIYEHKHLLGAAE